MNLMQGDCLDLLKQVSDKSIDMILCDLPYGKTRNRWDTQLPLEELWRQYNRIIKDNGVIALFCDGMFTAQVMMSNPKMWRYNLVWDKVLTTGFLNANRMPLRQHENIAIFYKKLPKYHPQKTAGLKNHKKGKRKEQTNNNYGFFEQVDNADKLGEYKHPTSILKFPKPHPSICVHPTQKPVELLEYLIQTYTDPKDIILDNCMGSGSTGVACVNTGRNFVGIEIDKGYFEIAKLRISEVENQLRILEAM